MMRGPNHGTTQKGPAVTKEITKHIIAMGGGGCHMDKHEDNKLDPYILSTLENEHPRICLIPTAGGDRLDEIGYFHEFFSSKWSPKRCELSVLKLFDRRLKDKELREFLLGQDLIYVFGGNTVSMLAVWRAHGVDKILREAYDAGITLCGLSAGAICWFDNGLLGDSLGPGVAEPIDALGFLPGSFSPHHANEAFRPIAFRQLIASGRMPAGWGVDDGVALHFEDGVLKEIVASNLEGSAAYVRKNQGGAPEELHQKSIRRL